MRVHSFRISALMSVLFVSLCLATEVGATGPAFVQAATKSASGSPSSISLSFSASTTAGDVILAAIDFNTNVGASSVTDSQGNVFTWVGNRLTTPDGVMHSRVFYATNIKGGADTIIIQLTGTTSVFALNLAEYSGVNPTNPIDAQAGTSGSAGTASSGNAATATAGDLIYGFCAGEASCTAGSGFTTRLTSSGNLVENKLAGNAGAYAATGTATGGWTMQMVALKPASSGTGQPPAITSPTTTSGTVGSAFSYQITATNTPTTYGATGLPAGLSVSSTSGLISGMPTTAGTSTVTLSATNASGTGNAALALTLASSQGQLMSLSSNKKYLVNTVTGKPVFVVGEDAFDLPMMLTTAQMTQYFQTRSQQGFNAVWLAAVDKTYTANPPKNVAGESPFDGSDFTNFDSGYWASMDAVIQQASSYGITVFLNPFFVANSSEQPAGYYTSLLAASTATLQSYATFLGDRYKGSNNIVWLLGGDSKPSDSGVFSQLNIFGTALAAADPNHLITLEACEQCVTNGYNSVSGFQAAGIAVPSWLTLNWAYPQYDTTVAASYNAYTASPFLPPIAGENFYELENSMTEPELRFEMYSEVLSGAYVGRIFGNGAVWSFNSPNGSTCVNGDESCRSANPTWQSELSSAGSVSQEYQGKLFRSREHWLLVPDASHTVVTAGYGSGLTVTTTARTSDGQTIISYIPNGNGTTISVNMAEITSSTSTVQGWWYDPATGATTNLGTFANSGTHNFTAPDSNDWVLVLDNAAASLPAPGSN